jgi:uncharacterized membrane protein YhaH (DUF805 family)
MADVFISYAREDQARAEQIARGLEAMGLQTFWDTEIPPGQTWADYIEGKLGQSKAVVVLWSEHSTKSQWVREEARMGRDKSKLIPAILDGSPAPLGFGEVQAADLTAWRGEANHPSWQRFANAVFSTARPGEPTPAMQAPSRPQPAYMPPPASSADGGVENLNFIGYVQKCLRLYVNGKGRARRAEYWWWALFSFLVYVVAYIIDAGVFGMNPYTSAPNQQVFYGVAFLALLAPSISVTSRRFHDVGLNGWLVAVAYGLYIAGALMAQAAMPLGAILVLVVFLVFLVVGLIPSRPGANQYGPNPKGQ